MFTRLGDTQALRRESWVVSSRTTSEILVCRSCSPFARVTGSRFWMFLMITTRSGGRSVKSTGFVVEDNGESGVNSPNVPNPEDVPKRLYFQTDGNERSLPCGGS